MNSQIEMIVEEVVATLKQQVFIPVEASGRHVHLSEKDLEQLFGIGYQLTKVKDLSQPGQYACKERVTVKGPKGPLKNVIVLGPPRKETQVEVSLTDALTLGIKPPIRQSGDIQNTPGATIQVEEKEVVLSHGVIVAKRHIHMTPEDAMRLHVRDGEVVKVKVFGSRPLIFEDTVVRVSEKFKTAMHIDYDEANSCGFSNGNLGLIIK